MKDIPSGENNSMLNLATQGKNSSFNRGSGVEFASLEEGTKSGISLLVARMYFWLESEKSKNEASLEMEIFLTGQSESRENCLSRVAMLSFPSLEM